METMQPKEQSTLPEHLRVAAANSKATRGEKLFDFFTYKVVNFGFNELLSLAIVDLFLGGSPDVAKDKPTSFFAQKFGDKGIKLSNKLSHAQDRLDKTFGSTGGSVFTLNMGGHVAAALVKVLENNRVGLSKRFDKLLDKVTGTSASQQELDNREARYEVLRNSPVKTGWQVAKGRLAGMAASMIFNQLPESIDEHVLKNKPSKEGFYGFRRMTGWAGKKSEPAFAGIAKAFGAAPEGEMGQKRLKYWSEVVLFETWCTAITSKVMEKVVKWGDNKPKEAPIAVATASAPTASTTTASTNNSTDRNALAEETSRRWANEEEVDSDRKRWSSSKYDPEDEVGISI